MTRSGYTEDPENDWVMNCWRGAVASALRGRRGQAFLREMLAALDMLPEKCLIRNELVKEGEVCVLGAVALARGQDVSAVNPEDHDTVASTFGIAHAMACEIMYENDEGSYQETREKRFTRMRHWIASRIIVNAKTA